MRAASRARQTRAFIIRTPYSDEGDSDKSNSIQMTSYKEESKLESGSDDGLLTVPSATPWASPSPPNTLTSRWYVTGMQVIHIDYSLTIERGKPARYIYEKPRVIPNSVPCLHDTIIR